MPINVVIADKQRLFREILKSKLDSEHDINIVGETDNGYECLSMINKFNPNVVIMDTSLNSLDGLKVIEIMKQQALRNKVMFLTDVDEPDNFTLAVDQGCDAFLLKNIEYVELKKAIYSVYRGDTYIHDDLKKYINSKKQIQIDKIKADNITKRELEILKLLAKGLTNKEISDYFNISDRTVKNHIFSLFKKIHVSDRTQAAVYAIKNGYVDLSR